MRAHNVSSLASVAVPLLVALTSCGGGSNAASVVRPSDPTAASALGEAPCHEADRYGEPLIVDWPTEQRSDLEVAMHEGVAVMSYSCKAVRLLKDCHIDGTYGFIGTTEREQVVKLENADEVQANLPTLGLSFLSKMSADMQRGATIDIALVTVGKRKTTWSAPTTTDLKGTCDGATHFVRGASVGAFALDTGTKGQLRAAAQIFGVGTQGSSESSKSVHNQDGKLDDCTKASPDSNKPPAQCGAPVRLELLAIAKDQPAPGDKPAKAKDAIDVPEPMEPCPQGVVFANGKCTTPAQAPAYQCQAGKADECTAQCQKGSVGSCATLGAMYAEGNGLARDFAKAAPFLKQGCDGGVGESCVALGMLMSGGRGVGRDVPGAAKLFDKACSDSIVAGCEQLGLLYASGTKELPANNAKAAGLLQRACDGGSDVSCGKLGVLYANGQGVTRDPAKAVAAFRRACQGRDAESCARLADAMERGDGTGRDFVGAGIFYQRACYGQYFEGCVGAGRLQLTQGNSSEAKRLFELGCNFGSSFACAMLNVGFGQKRIVMPDVARQQQLLASCHGGSSRDCALVGVWDLATGGVMGKQELQQACNMGEKLGCVLNK